MVKGHVIHVLLHGVGSKAGLASCGLYLTGKADLCCKWRFLYFLSFSVGETASWCWRLRLRNTRRTNANKEESWVVLCLWGKRRVSRETRLRSDCSSDTTDCRPWSFKAGTIFLLGVIQAPADGHWGGLGWIPQACLSCAAEQMGSARGTGFRAGMVAAQAGVGSCQCVCCMHGEKWAKLWEGGDSVHVLVKPDVSCYAFGSLAVHVWLYISGESNKSDWIGFKVLQESQWLGKAQQTQHWDVSDSTGTSEISFFKLRAFTCEKSVISYLP